MNKANENLQTRVKSQHFVPKFYLKNFCDDEGYIWTHDSRRGDARRSFPEDTGLEKNIYSPEIADGKRFDHIEAYLSDVESAAAPIVQKLLRLEELSDNEKGDMALFLASMFVRSPAQIRQFARAFGEVANWATERQADFEIKGKKQRGELTEIEELAFDLLNKPDALEMNVDRRVGLMGFGNISEYAEIIMGMKWTFEISKDVELITSDNPVFWVPAAKLPPSPYGFGMAHPYAVIPFVVSPSLILRLDHSGGKSFQKFVLHREQAKKANRLQAVHKDNCLYYRRHHDGLHRLGMKYAKPVQQLQAGHATRQVNVVRALKD
jgi:hypothetical protein